MCIYFQLHNRKTKLFQDTDPIDSFYYVNWDDPIYDQFDDYGERLDKGAIVDVENGEEDKGGLGAG